MTEVMNFFQAVLMFKGTTFAGATKQEVKKAVVLKREAEDLALKADEEMRNGREAQVLAFKADENNKIRVFTEISIWHHERAAEKYGKSAEKFEQAGNIQTGKSKVFNAAAEQMTCRAGEAESAVNLLNNFLKNN